MQPVYSQHTKRRIIDQIYLAVAVESNKAGTNMLNNGIQVLQVGFFFSPGLAESVQHFIKLLVELLKGFAHFIVMPEINCEIRVSDGFQKIGQFAVDVGNILIQEKSLGKDENPAQNIN